MLTPTQMQQLKTELLTDPNTYGYAPLIADTNNPALAAEVNKPRVSISINRTDVSPEEIRRSILVAEFISAQTILMGSWFESLMQAPAKSIVLKKADGTNANDLINLKKMLINNSASEDAVVALATRKGSRAEQLFGEGVSVSVQEVIDAQRL